MRILITGGTGFIGRALCRHLSAVPHELIVLSRRPGRVPELCGSQVCGIRDFGELAGTAPIDAVINLAGEGIADRRWTSARRRQLRASRIDVTRALVTWMEGCALRPSVLISGSAIGWYGDQGDRELDEQSAPAPDFAHGLCRDWEFEAMTAQRLGVRVCVLRTGVVLGADGGMLKKLLPAFCLGLGGQLGSGRQWLSWIARDDLLALIEFLLHRPDLQGVFNATSPQPATNAEFTRTLARVLRRPALLLMPAVVLQLLLGEMAQLLLGGQRVLPRRALAAGFQFRYPALGEALRALLRA